MVEHPALMVLYRVGLMEGTERRILGLAITMLEVVASFYLVLWALEASATQQSASKYAQSVLGPFLEEVVV
jgi:hypothetical protein